MSERIAQAATSVSYAASGGVTLFGALSFNEIIALAGLMVAVFTAGINWYYRHKSHKLDEEKLAMMYERYRLEGENES